LNSENSLKFRPGFANQHIHEPPSHDRIPQQNYHHHELEDSAVLRSSFDFNSNQNVSGTIRRTGEGKKNIGPIQNSDVNVSGFFGKDHDEENTQKINTLQFPKVRLKDKLTEVSFR
jgi:hypothetical protein